MKEKELLFCQYYLQTGNPREAAAKAGYRLAPERWGLKLLSLPHIREALQTMPTPTRDGIAGLERIAFGSVADGVGLLLDETPPDRKALETMDLFMISEIKKPKGGGLEIKFYDRLKAMELLCQYAGGKTKESALPFYEALQEGAIRLKGLDRT